MNASCWTGCDFQTGAELWASIRSAMTAARCDDVGGGYMPNRSIAPQFIHLVAYFDRLMDRPSVARTIDAARPFFQYYPGRIGLARRFFEPE